MMSAAVSSAGFMNFGSMPYDDIYLEDASSDEDEADEHVISNSRKPLMSPRRRPRITLRQPPATVKVHPLIKRRILRWCYVIVSALFISLMVFILLRISHDAMSRDDDLPVSFPEDQESPKKKPPPPAKPSKPGNEESILPCTDFEVEDVWVQNIPKLLTETAVRLVDVNKDDILDVVMGFSTGVTSYFGDQFIMCDIYFNGTSPCFGGLLALDGRTGKELWRHYASNEIFAVNCNADIDQDGVKDCLGAGRAGSFKLVSGATGREIWKFNNKELLVSISNFYTAQFIQDVDGDGIHDVLNIHGGDPLRNPDEEVTHIGLLVIMSGATGRVVTSMPVPGGQESYYSPQVYYQHGGRQMVLFGTGGETHGGSLWVMSMRDLLHADDTKVTAIYSDPFKGIMTPPTLADITGDGVVDIVMAMFNSTTVAFDGQSLKQLWNYTMPESESYSTPAAALFNDDDIPDFMIAYNHGPGYPLYYYSQVTVLDGRTGQPILDAPVRTAGSSQASPLAISVEGKGHDLFMYFTLDCLGHEGESSEFQFFQEDNLGKGAKSRSDFCQQRFSTKSYTRLQLLNQHMKTPGKQIYNSMDRVDFEYQYKMNSSLLAQAYLDKHPSVLEEAKELALNGEHSHDGGNHVASGETHSGGRGDPDAPGGIHSEDGGDDTDSNNQVPESQAKVTDLLDLMSKERQNDILLQLAKELGYDDVSDLPMIQTLLDSESLDDEQDLYRPDVAQNVPESNPYQELPDLKTSEFDLQNLDDQTSEQQNPDLQNYPQDHYDLQQPGAQDSYPNKHYPPNPDPRISNLPNPVVDDPVLDKPDLHNPDPLSPHAEKPDTESGGSHGSYPQDTSAEVDSDSGMSTKVLQNLLNQLLDEEGRDDSVDQQPDVDKSAGHFNNEPRYHSRDRTEHTWRDEANQKSYLNTLLGKLGHTDNEKPPLRGYDGYRRGGGQSDKYGKALTDENPLLKQRAKWLDKIYGDDQPVRRHFTQKRDTLANQDEAVKEATGTRRRFSRHVGPHDGGGIQRLISTGSLAPVLPGSGVAPGESIDVIFATYWFYPSQSQIILPEQQECIDKWMANEAQRLNPKNVFYGLDHDAYEHMASDECLKKGSNKEKLRAKLSSLSPLDIYPFNRHTGEMTVYRLRLKCRCGITPSANKRCTKVLPYSQQQWGGYMGTYGNSQFPPRS